MAIYRLQKMTAQRSDLMTAKPSDPNLHALYPMPMLAARYEVAHEQ